MIAAGIGIEAQGEGQHAPPFPFMHPVDFDDGADRPLLLDGDGFDPAGESDAATPFGRVVDAGDERERPHHLAIARPGAGDGDRAAARDAPARDAADDVDRIGGFAQQHRAFGRLRAAGNDVERAGLVRAGGQRMGRPFERTIGPGGERPMLRGQGLAIAAQAERRAGPYGPARPGHAECLAQAERRGVIIDPADRRLRRPGRRGASGGWQQRGGAAEQAGAQHVAAADGELAGHVPSFAGLQPDDREIA